MFAKVNSIGLFGIDTYKVTVEADAGKGMPSFDIVGLPDSAVRESRDRVRSAMKNSGFAFPLGKIVINLAPADVKKIGSVYDLPMLIALLKSSGQIGCDLEDCAFVGELSLDGTVRHIDGVIAMTIEAKKSGIQHLFVPKGCEIEGSVVKGVNVYGVSTVTELINHLNGSNLILPELEFLATVKTIIAPMPDFSEVKGQAAAKRALEIAAAGGHNVLMIGPPGSGKSMLAKRLPSILPRMTFEESIEATKIHSVAGRLSAKNPLITERPFRSPHHTVSAVALSGGGTIPAPGELSLAHTGVLFLDELPEFSRSTMEALRAPLEDGEITISRAAGSLTYPCEITLVAAMNPCPCGFYGHSTKKCTCSDGTVSKYLSKVSGPMLDRLDLHVEVPAVDFDSLKSNREEEGSQEIRIRIEKARWLQQQRYKGTGVTCNAQLTPTLMVKYCTPSKEAEATLRDAFEHMGLSARSYDRLLKVARTIADLDGCESIERVHIMNAIQFRTLDRKYWKN